MMNDLALHHVWPNKFLTDEDIAVSQDLQAFPKFSPNRKLTNLQKFGIYNQIEW